MTNSAALLALVVAAAGTYAFRGGLILVLAGRQLPGAIERALQHVGPAVLAALTVSLAVGGNGDVGLTTAEFAALAVAAGVAWWRKNLVWTLVAGMATLWVVTALT